MAVTFFKNGAKTMGQFKKSLIFVFSFILINSISTYSSNGFWIKSNGPVGGLITSMLFKDNNIYCAGSGGLYNSSDGANSWEYLGLGNLRVREIAQDSKYIYVAGYYDCYRYDPDQDQFSKIYQGTVQTITILDTILLIGKGYYPGLLRSTDFGDSWEESNIGLDNYDIEKLFVTDSKVILAAACGASGSGIFRSTDFGVTWERINSDPYAWTFHGICEFNNILYAFDYGNYVKIYVSYDDGLTWRLPPGSSAPADHIYAVHADFSGLYVGTSDYGVFRSTNMGHTWKQINNGLKNLDIIHFNYHENTHYIGGFDGIYTKSAQSTQWEQKVTGLANTKVNALIVFQNKLFAATHGAGLQISTDDGLNWTRLNIAENRNYINDIYSTGQDIFVIASYDYLYPFGGKLYKSSDGGQSWTSGTSGIGGMLECIAGYDKFLLIGTEYGLFMSNNSGDTWQKITNGVPKNINVSDVAVSDSIAIVVNGTAGVYRTEDYGETWQYFYVPGLFSGSCVKEIGGRFFLGSGSVNEIFSSEDGGITWYELNVPLYNASVQDFAGDGEYIFAALSSGGGVIASSDSGKTWETLNTNLLVSDVECLLYKSNKLFAGTDGGSVFRYVFTDKPITLLYPADNSLLRENSILFTWRKFCGATFYHFQLAEDSTFSSILIDNNAVTDTFYQVKYLDYNKNYYYRVGLSIKHFGDIFSAHYSFRIGLPDSYIFYQNSPNPFNLKTTIRFELPKAERVKLLIYNILGQRVKTLADRKLSPGSYRLKWNGTNDAGDQLASGIYLLHFKAGNFVQNRRMVLMK